MSFEFKVKGLRELEVNLNALPDRIHKRVLRTALKKAGEPIRKDAVRRARVAVGGPTYTERYVPKSSKSGGERGPGHMAEHIISVTRMTKRKGAVVQVGPDQDHWYLAFQEFGTPNAPAEPVLRPALETQAKEAVGILRDELGNGVEREARKLHRLIRASGEL